MGEWTTLGALDEGDIFETRDGRSGVRMEANGGHHECSVLWFARAGKPRWLDDNLEVRRIDLRFLLAAAADRLQEHDAYQRGLRDGAASMRERAAATVDRMVDESLEPVDIGCADAIRHLELVEG